MGVEPNAPDVEELAEGELADDRRLDVDDPARVVGVDRRQDQVHSIDPDVRGDRDPQAIHEEIEMLMGVLDLALGRQDLEAIGLETSS